SWPRSVFNRSEIRPRRLPLKFAPTSPNGQNSFARPASGRSEHGASSCEMDGLSCSGRLGLLPPPLWGRAGEGVVLWQRERASLATPTPNPSPQGGGERTE